MVSDYGVRYHEYTHSQRSPSGRLVNIPMKDTHEQPLLSQMCLELFTPAPVDEYA